MSQEKNALDLLVAFLAKAELSFKVGQLDEGECFVEVKGDPMQYQRDFGDGDYDAGKINEALANTRILGDVTFYFKNGELDSALQTARIGAN